MGVLAGALLGLLSPVAVAEARQMLARATDGERLASPELQARAAQAWPRRPLPLEWRWSPASPELGTMFRRAR